MIEHRIGPSRRTAAVHAASKVTVRPLLRYFPMSGPAARLIPHVDTPARWLPRASGTVHQPVVARHWRGELVTPIDGPTAPGAILYFHGGAFLLGGTHTHRRLVERLAATTGLSVLSVDYRQLPFGTLEHSISDCVDAFGWLVRQGHPASGIVLAGDSAGGHLAFATALRLRDEGLGAPAGIVGLSPWLDFDHRPKMKHHNRRRDAYIPARRMRRLGLRLVEGGPQHHHSPVNADLGGLPPALIICAEAEVLRVDAEVMTERLEEAGVPVTLQVWEGTVHAFPVLAGLTPESAAAADEVAQFAVGAIAGALSGRGRGHGEVRSLGIA